jgi:hypothetical protein
VNGIKLMFDHTNTMFGEATGLIRNLGEMCATRPNIMVGLDIPISNVIERYPMGMQEAMVQNLELINKKYILAMQYRMEGIYLFLKLHSQDMIIFGDTNPILYHSPDVSSHPLVVEMKNSMINTRNFNNEFSQIGYVVIGMEITRL